MAPNGDSAVNTSSLLYRDDFHHSTTDEPHATRRKQILAKHPEIEKLFGSDSRVVPVVLLIMASQLAIAYYQTTWSWPFFLFIAWSYGGAANHSLSLMTHELSHNLVFELQPLNDYFGIFCNVAMGLPSSTMFKRYHMEHHMFQGDPVRDVDIPTHWEGTFFTNTALKLIWMILQPAFYAIRPLIVRHKDPRLLDIINMVTIVVTDIIIVSTMGPRALLYLILSTLLGMGLHPVAGHFISEHYVFTENFETYSYYGPLNYICWNVGYHNEHHDFPRVPGWKLPYVKAMAPEFYDKLPCYSSWTKVIFDYITNPKMGPFSRMVRDTARGNADADAKPVQASVANKKKN